MFCYLLMGMLYDFVLKSTDTNECIGNSSICGKHSSCINTIGSYYCQCQHGFIHSSKKANFTEGQCIGKCVWHALFQSALTIVYSMFFFFSDIRLGKLTIVCLLKLEIWDYLMKLSYSCLTRWYYLYGCTGVVPWRYFIYWCFTFYIFEEAS